MRKEVKLGTLGDIFIGLTYKPENVVGTDGTIVLRSSNIQEGKIDLEDIVRVNCSIKEKLWVKDNDILMCSRNGSAKLVGKTALICGLPESMTFGAFMTIIRTPYNNYLQYFFRSPFFRRQLNSSATTTINQITRSMLDCMIVPVFDSITAGKIVEVLSKCEQIIFDRKKELQKLDDLIKARFVEMFGDPISNEKGWKTVELNSVCNGIGDGLHGTPEYNENGEYPFINGNNLMNGVIEITPATKMVDEETYKKHFIKITDNAILLSINGTLGKLAFYNGEEVMLGKSACYCNLKPEINREFVYGVMKTDAFAGFLESNATASTIKNVGLKAIRGFRLILPPQELQIQFVEFTQQVDKSKSVAQKALDEAQLLFDSLMQKYFG